MSSTLRDGRSALRRFRCVDNTIGVPDERSTRGGLDSESDYLSLILASRSGSHTWSVPNWFPSVSHLGQSLASVGDTS